MGLRLAFYLRLGYNEDKIRQEEWGLPMGIEQKRAFIIQVIYYAILAAAGVAVIKWGLPMVSPFVLGFLVAYLLRRPTRYLVSRLHLPHKPVALGLVLVFYSTIGLLLAFLAIRAFALLQTLVNTVPFLYTAYVVPAIEELFAITEGVLYEMDETLFNLVQGYGNRFLESLGSFVTSLSGKVVGFASNLAISVPDLFLRLVLVIISTCFIAADYDVLRAFFLRQVGEKSAAMFVKIREYLVGTLFVCIGSYTIIATLTFLELSIGLSILKLSHPILVAFLVAIFDIMPVVGTGTIVIPWAVIELILGDVPMGLGLLVIYVVITVIRNIVEPKFVGGQLGLHPVVTLASMFVGLQMFGILGLFGLPVGLSLLRYLDDSGSIHIFK